MTKPTPVSQTTGRMASPQASEFANAPIDVFEPGSANPFSKLLGSADTSVSRLPTLGPVSASPTLPGGAYTPTGPRSSATWEEKLRPGGSGALSPIDGQDHLPAGLDALGATSERPVIDGPQIGDGPNMQRGAMGDDLQRPLFDGVGEAAVGGAVVGISGAVVTSIATGGATSPSIPLAAAGGAITGATGRMAQNVYDEFFGDDEEAPPPPPPPSPSEDVSHQVEPSADGEGAFPSWWRGTEFDPDGNRPEAGESWGRDPRVERPSDFEADAAVTTRRPKDSPADPVDLARDDRAGSERAELEARTGGRTGPEVINPAIG